MSNLRVCIVSPLFYPDLGGVARQAFLLTAKLKEYGVNLFVLSRKMKDVPEFRLPSDIEVHFISAFRPNVHNLEEMSLPNFLTSLSFSLRLALKLFLMRKQYDIVHFHGASLPLIISLPVLRLLKKKVIAKVLASGLGTEAGSFKGKFFLMGNILSYIMRGVDLFIAISDKIARGLIEDGVHPNKIKRVTNFVDVTKFYPLRDDERHKLRSDLSLDQKVVINFTGRIVKRKGLDVLFNAIAEKKEALPLCVFLIVGTGPEESKIKKLASDLGITDKTKFLGHSTEVEVIKYYQASDMFVFPSYAEGMPNSLLEAMACGLPVIASRIGGVVDVVEDGKSGILFEPGDVSSLVSAIVKLLNDAELRQRLGTEARKRIVESFSIDRIADEYIKLYSRLMADS